VSKQNLNLFIAAFDAIKIIKIGIELKKLWPFKIKGVKTSKKQTTKYYKGQFPNTKKNPCMLLKLKNDL